MESRKLAHLVDGKNRHILRLVQKHADMTHADIGKQVGLEACSVSRRIERMEKEKAILLYQAIVSRELFEYPETAFVLVRLKVHEAGPFLAFRDEILPIHFPNVIECFK